MATVSGSIDLSLEEASAAMRAAAAKHGYALDEGQSEHDELVFKKGVTLVSWGSQLAVQLEEVAPKQTSVTISTGETFAITDWGRGKRAAEKLLADAGAHS